MFVITLVMTLLTGMGIFATRAAGMTELASGYDRLNEQTHYLLQHGVGLVLGEISRAPDVYSDPSRPQMQNTCYSGQWMATANVPQGVSVSYPCASFNNDSLAASMAAAQLAAGKPSVPSIAPALLPGNAPPVAAADQVATKLVPGSLGPTPLNARVFVEFSDFGYVGRPPAGTSVGGSGATFTYLQGTLSAWAQIGPYTSNGNVCGVAEQNLALITARETGRSYVILGPVPKNNTSQ